MDKIIIEGLEINNVTYEDLTAKIEDSIKNSTPLLITYANANTINSLYSNGGIKHSLSSFDVIHPDGTGIYLASKFLYGSNGFRERVTGSDYYPLLAEKAIQHKWKIFFFGHDEDTLIKIRRKYPGLNICGSNEGFNYSNEEVINKINSAQPDIVIIGLSFPLQEKWLLENKDKLKLKSVICAGDGIKVFAGSKIRGPKVVRYLGFEWAVRFLTNPIKYFKRYIIGNPLFLYRIISLKIRKFRG